MANLSFKDIFRREFEKAFSAGFDKEAAKYRKISNTYNHTLLYNQDNLERQLVPFLGAEKAKKIAEDKTKDFLAAVTSKYGKLEGFPAAMESFNTTKTFKLLIESGGSDVFTKIQKWLLRDTLKLSGDTWRISILEDWLKTNGATLDQVMFGVPGTEDRGLLNPYLTDEGDFTSIDTEALNKDLKTKIKERYAQEHSDTVVNSSYFTGNLTKQIKLLKGKMGKYGFADGKFSFDNFPITNRQHIAGLMLNIIYILGKDPGAQALIALKGGLDLGHVVSVQTELIGKGIINGLLASIDAKGIPAEEIEAAEKHLSIVLVQMFDDPSISIEEVWDGKNYEKALIAENAELNRGAKAALLRDLTNDLLKGSGAQQANKSKLVEVLNSFVTSLQGTAYTELTKRLKNLDFSELLTSPSFIDNIEKIIDAEWDGKSLTIGNKKKLKTKARLRAPARVTKTKKTTRNLGPNKLASMPKVKLKPLSIPTQKRKESFLNLTKIKLYVNSHMHDRMEETMRGQRLNYRTGRLARSARVHNIQQTRKDTVALYYTYMKNPYATFAKGGKQHTPRRDVDNLIMASARSLAREVVANKFKLSVRGT